MASAYVVVTGAAGRMGKAVTRGVLAQADMRLGGACELSGSPSVGKDAGGIAGMDEAGVVIEASLEQALEAARAAASAAGEDASAMPVVVIDFTGPEASANNAAVCAAAGVPICIGSTGLKEAELTVVRQAAEKVAVVMAPNMSLGINLMLSLAARAARALGEDFDVELVEAHHRNKVDAPSGTALRIAEVVTSALGRDLEKDAVYERRGAIGARSRTEIGIQTLRGGDVVGEHTLYFLGDGERLELTHRATGREVFVKGALRAAKWLVGMRSGLYGMEDVLGIE